MKLQLFCTFCKKRHLNDTIDTIISNCNIQFNKIFVLDNISKPDEYILTYNIDIDENDITGLIKKTISAHRKKESNTIYTINALNYLVALLNDGMESKEFSVPWKNYKNMVLVTNNTELKKLETKLKTVIYVDKFKSDQLKYNQSLNEEINYNR